MFLLDIKFMLTWLFTFKYMLRVIFIDLIIRTYCSKSFRRLIVIIRVSDAYISGIPRNSHSRKRCILFNRKAKSIKLQFVGITRCSGLCPTLGAVGGENIPTVAADVVDESAKTLIGAAARSRL